MTFATYADRATVHPDRVGVARTAEITLGVIHTSEGGEGATVEGNSAAENLAGFMGQPGDRVTSSGSRYGASYHDVFDTDRVIPCVPHGTVTKSASGGNHQGVHACHPGRAGQNADEWDDPVSEAQLEQAARWIADVHTEHGLPIVKLTAEEVRAGVHGFCGHDEVSDAFGLSDHWDPGPAYPWKQVIDRAKALVAPLDFDLMEELMAMTPEQRAALIDEIATATEQRIFNRRFKVYHGGKITDATYGQVVPWTKNDLDKLRTAVGAVDAEGDARYGLDSKRYEYLVALLKQIDAQVS